MFSYVSSPLEQFDVIYVFQFFFPFFHLDFSLLSTVVPGFIAILFLVFGLGFFNNSFFDKVKVIPRGFNSFFDYVYLFITDTVKEQIGDKGVSFTPFLFSIFFFLLICNMLSMIPFGIALTSHIVMTFLLSLSIGMTTVILGLLYHQLNFFKLFVPKCPFVLMPFLMIIEIFSFLIRFFSLAIRLSANIMAGHTLVFLISKFLLNMIKTSYIITFMFVPFLFSILVLELGVAFLQAYVFLILTCIYFSETLILGGH